jgi:rod shape-determining protein MreC
VIRLSIQARQALAKLTLPVLIAASFGLMLLGKADALLAERARMALADALAPIYAALAPPLASLRDSIAGATDLWDVRAENLRLRDESDLPRRWQSIALALDAEAAAQGQSGLIPDGAQLRHRPAWWDAGGSMPRRCCCRSGRTTYPQGRARDERGLVGRVTEVVARTALVLLLTDLNSRIPVILENSRAHAILVGTNGTRPRLTYWAEGAMPQEGERVVTSTEASAFPANLPVGMVHFSAANVPEVVPVAMLGGLEGASSTTALAASRPRSPGRLPERRGR